MSSQADTADFGQRVQVEAWGLSWQCMRNQPGLELMDEISNRFSVSSDLILRRSLTGLELFEQVLLLVGEVQLRDRSEGRGETGESERRDKMKRNS